RGSAPPEPADFGVLSRHVAGAHEPADTGLVLLRPDEGRTAELESPCPHQWLDQEYQAQRGPQEKEAILRGGSRDRQLGQQLERCALIMPLWAAAFALCRVGAECNAGIRHDGAGLRTFGDSREEDVTHRGMPFSN